MGDVDDGADADEVVAAAGGIDVEADAADEGDDRAGQKIVGTKLLSE
ncbi:hypothetical protein IU443_13125 [Nocardia farcinica]|nr:hypothetical protein [Nocardia farcinica]MBF6262498.1 hypothetical protein [Nocardia farcinica]MBF6284356.1 hypothetical protein [Nocardia farcinica]MBF6308856.1 hypothetical protein [Nocardia farcinica]MBF6390892.1 hypothetical protein [Nocardia farcinica]MBF6562091.1 hypothetical protein [Nocardia farcinica]